MNKKSKIFLAGHKGLAGSAVYRLLIKKGYDNIIIKNHSELDLTRQKDVEDFFLTTKPEYVINAAAKAGGIIANLNHKAEFYYQNAMISQNIIHYSYISNVKKLMNLGSSCIYPKLAKQPLKEEYLLTGPLESTNDAYAIAKISAIKMCSYYNLQYNTNFLSVMPTNLYGQNDNFDLETSHVLPAMIRKFHEAKINNTSVELWGDGSPLREFLHVDDLSSAIVYLMENKDSCDIGEFINVGTGKDCTIKDLANLIAKVTGFKGRINWDFTKPNGTPRKLLDISRLNNQGWTPKISLEEGIEDTYNWYLSNIEQ